MTMDTTHIAPAIHPMPDINDDPYGAGYEGCRMMAAAAIEQLAQEWDGRKYGTDGSMVDIGTAIREASARLGKVSTEQFIYAVAADGVSESGDQLYTIHDEPVPMADNWRLVASAIQPAQAHVAETNWRERDRRRVMNLDIDWEKACHAANERAELTDPKAAARLRSSLMSIIEVGILAGLHAPSKAMGLPRVASRMPAEMGPNDDPKEARYRRAPERIAYRRGWNACRKAMLAIAVQAPIANPGEP